MITSKNSPQIKTIVKLQNQAKERDKQGAFVIEGGRMFAEAMASYKDGILRAYVSERYYRETLREDKAYFQGVPFELLSEDALREAAQTVTPQGLLAVVRKPHADLEGILMQDEAALLVLEDIRDPGNLGTMIRTAEAAGMSGILLGRGCVDVYNPKVIRSTMGSVFRVPFQSTEDLYETMADLKKNQFVLYGAHLGGSINFTQAGYARKLAVLIGNEAEGLSSRAAGLCDQKIRIPMEGKVESLNAAVAAALLMYACRRS